MSDARYPTPTLFIGGAWLSGGGRDFHQVINPATGEPLAELPLATSADLDAALDAADKGFKLWRRVSAYDRAKVLRKAAELIRERADQIATMMVLEEGKPLAEARMEVMGSADQFEWFAEEGRRAYGRLIPARAEGVRQIVMKQPVGPVAAFAPWNFPAVTPARKIAASLGAGCSCIIKPAEETPATCLALAKALDDAGLPKGVLNVVFGVPSQVSAHLIGAAQIRKVSFTGSTAVGKQLAALAAQGAKNWAVTPRSSCSRMPKSRPRRPSRSRPSSAMPARSASRRPASMSMTGCMMISSRASPAWPRRCRSATGSIPRPGWVRSPTADGSTP